MRLSSVSGVVLVVLSACSQSPKGGGEIVANPARAAAAIDAVMPRMAKRLAAPRRSEGGWMATRGNTRIALPTTATAKARFEISGDKGTWLEASAVGLRDRAATLSGDRLVYENVAPSTDLVLATDGELFEELRVLHDDKAPTHFTWKLSVDSSIATVRAREGRIELVDANEYVRLATAPLVAIDAKKNPRKLTVATRRCGESWCADATLDASGLAYPIVVDPLWSAGPSMAAAHEDQPLWKLPSGKIVAGGGVAPTIEIFDPATNKWTNVGELPDMRYQFGVVTTAAGDILVVGGNGKSDVYKYTVASGTWSIAPGTLNFPGVAEGPNVLLTRLSDGRILKYAISGTSYQVEIYDGAKWTTNAGPTAAFGIAHPPPPSKAIVLPDGRTFIALGSNGFGTYSAALFDPKTNGWAATAAEPVRQTNFAGHVTPVPTLLADGRVLVTDGPAGPALNASVWNPATDAWVTTGAQLRARYYGNAVLLPSGRVLSATGGATAARDPMMTEYYESEVYDVPTNSWHAVENFPASPGVEGAGMILLNDGRVLVAGGQPLSSYTNLTWIYTPAANGAACSFSGYGCASGTCADGFCCEKASCGAGFTCGSTAFPGKCVKVQGGTCATDAECGTGHCVDGVCCESACTGLCARCNGATPGLCTKQVGAPVAGRGACPAGGATTCSKYTCDGKNAAACVLAPSTTACSTTACAGGVETHASFCDGAGACADVPKTCAPYACGTGVTCLSSCTASTDCALGSYCKANKCVPIEGLGGKCTADGDCTGGTKCVDGVCCALPGAACPTGSTCAAPGKEGTCTKKNGTVCADGTECASGFCADGVCCDTACGGQCEACDVADAVTKEKGKCVPVAGAPHGTRAACTTATGSEACSSAVCDGTTTGSCTGFAGSETPCREESCTAGVYTSPSSCNGSGSCPAAVTVECGGYACDDAGKKCRTSCSAKSDCAQGYDCRAGSCAKIAATCSDDGLSSTPLGGAPQSCSPYVCNTDGTCRTTCSNTTDCAPGNACDTSSSLCVAAATESDSGGCSMSGPASARAPWLLGLLAALVVARRRALRSH
jgi:hypothetical protein